MGVLQELAFEPPLASRREPPQPLNAEDCRSLAQTYRLLGAAFAEEPCAEFLAGLRAPQALEALAEAGVRFDADFTSIELPELVDALALEYGTLFVASGGCPPVESVRLTGRYYQGPNFAVKQAYRAAGFEAVAARFQQFDDQLGVELMFVAQLLERAAGAAERVDSAEYRRVERDIRRFWSVHLGRWVRGYASLVARAAEHSFYREMARLLAAFAESELERLQLKVEDVDGGRASVPKSEVQVAFNADEPVCGACPGAAPMGA